MSDALLDAHQSRKDSRPAHLAHRSRQSLLTTASGIADSCISFGSLTTGEARERLAEFPLPPPPSPGILSTFEELGLPSPVGSDFTVTLPDTPTALSHVTIPYPPFAPTQPLVYRKNSHFAPKMIVGPSAGTHGAWASRPVIIASAPALPDAVSPSEPTPQLTLASQSPRSHVLSPHDWHEGSSSIDVGRDEDRLLSTRAITTLLSSMTAGEDDFPRTPQPPLSPRNMYESSVVSDVFSAAESTVTYPPPRYMDRGNMHVYPPQPSRDLPIVPSASTNSHFSPTRHYASHGLSTPPESIRTYESGAVQSYETGGTSVVRTASVSRGLHKDLSVVGVAPATLHSLSNPPSIHTTTSTTALLQQSFSRPETIPEAPGAPSATASRSNSRYRRERRQSTFSTKTAKSKVSSIVTRVTQNAVKQAAARFRKKPLPPVPTIPNISLSQEIEHRKVEAALPLPDLVNRAQLLSRQLNRDDGADSSFAAGLHDMSITEADTLPAAGYGQGVRNSGAAAHPDWLQRTRDRRGRSQDFKEMPPPLTPDTPDTKPEQYTPPKTRRVCTVVAFPLIVVCVIIAIGVGIVVGQKHSSTTPSCPAGMTGAACSLNATCICTSTFGNECSQLAQSLVDLVPTLNVQFNANFTPASLSKALWEAQGVPTSTDCSGQARLIDVAPALESTTFPNRTTWAQTALLWEVVTSQDLSNAAQLQKFIVNAAWSALGTTDGPVTNSSSQFSVKASGYVFDFAAQSVTPPSATFIDQGQPSQAQIQQVNDQAKAALDRMYSFALASSTQQQKALSNYWTNVLQQKQGDLTTFLSAISGSPIMIPFDATLPAAPGADALSSLLSNSTTAPFPPPLSCYPGLSSVQMQRINSIETSVFGLSAASPASKFDTSCFPGRPIYGVLDILRLRLPFTDSRPGAAKQAAVLRQAAYPRAVVYGNEALSALPGASDAPNITALATNPRQYGTLNNFQHVILQYLSSISDVNVAIALVKFVLSQPAVPPTSDNSTLFNALSTLPTLEVAVFGTVDPSDIDSTVSSLAKPSGSLFFGTDESLAVRDWTIVACQTSVSWTDIFTAPEVARDGSFDNANFNAVWDPAFAFFHFSNNATVNVGNITVGFSAEKLLSP